MKKIVATKNASIRQNIKSLFSRTMLGKIKQSGSILLSGEQAKMSQMAKVGEEICITLPTGKKASATPSSFPLFVAYEDEDILVVEKPSGMPTHTSRANTTSTLENAVCGLKKSRGENVENFTFHPITRLDCDTSGLVLIAKNPISARKLSSDIASGKIQKSYLALVCGEVKEDFCIKIKMGRLQKGKPHRWQKQDGKDSETTFVKIGVFENQTLLEATPKTGRTHQIRVHTAYAGLPIVGDRLYQNGGIANCEKPEQRLQLHMQKLIFEDMLGCKVEVKSLNSPFSEFFCKK